MRGWTRGTAEVGGEKKAEGVIERGDGGRKRRLTSDNLPKINFCLAA